MAQDASSRTGANGPAGGPEQWLQISIRILAVLGATMLGITQSDPTLPALSLFGCVTSYFFTDRWGWFRLNRYVGYVAMIAAAAVTLGDFLQYNTLRQLLAIASLLVYVQTVLLYQKKNPRVYEQIGIFCSLQVIIAALLTSEMYFGALLVVYLLVALGALASYALYREHLLIASQRSSVVPSRQQLRTIELEDNAPAWRKALGTRPIAYFPVSPQRWTGQGMDASYAYQIGWLAIAALLFATVFFYRTPRHVPDDSFDFHGLGARVGFTEEPTLDEMGTVLQSKRTVMRVWYVDHYRNVPVKAHGDPYLRGSVLTNYQFDRGQGRWTQQRRVQGNLGDMLAPPPDDPFLVRQEVVMEPTNRALLFSVSPAYRIPQTPEGIRLWPETRQLYWPDAKNNRRLEYAVGTTAFRYGMQTLIVMHDSDTDTSFAELSRLEKSRLLEFERERLPRLAALAEDILASQNVDRTNRILVARTLRNHFHEQGRYTYTLNLNMQRDRGVDPLEAFVAEHRRGHCQYFAGALTLMLRSQGMPARMVVGFKPDEYNPMGNYYIVRDRDAHAWVEAYLEPEQVPEGAFTSGEPTGGAWLRLDPTPGTSVDGFGGEPRHPLSGQVGNAMDYAQLLWQDYVLGRAAMSGQITPETRHDNDFSAEEEEESGDLLGHIAQWMTWLRDLLRGSSGGGGNLRLALFLLLLFALVATLVQSRSQFLERLASWFRREAATAQEKQRVEFYERFEALCQRRGVRRRRSQTQHEFADTAAAALENGEFNDCQPLVERIIALFYRVRFGGKPLDSAESQFVEQALTELESTATH